LQSEAAVERRDSGEYVSFIISDNYDGAHGTGKALAEAMKAKGREEGSVGRLGTRRTRRKDEAVTRGGLRDGGSHPRHACRGQGGLQ
jgi:ABC-type sugar transport system substrate-binding protein